MRLAARKPTRRRLRFAPGLALAAALGLGGAPGPARGQPCPQPPAESYELLPPLLLRARAWLEADAPLCAEELLEATLERYPDSAEALALLGRARVLLREHRSAEAPLRRAVELGRGDLQTLLYLGAALWENGDLDGAEEVFRRAGATSGGHGAALRQLGRLLLWRGRFAEAAEVLARAAARGRPSPELEVDRARALDGAGRTEEALAAYRRAVELAPEHTQARYGLALLLERLGEAEAARREMEVYDRLYRRGQEETRRAGLERARAAAGFEEVEEAPAMAADPASSPGDGCGGVRLAEVAAASGLDFRHEPGASGAKHLPETMGAGLAWLDFDGDGRLDLYLVQSGRYPPAGGPEAANRLYRGVGGGRFEEVAESGAEDRGYGQGVVAADVDGDRDLDLYVANVGPDVLLLNRGDGRFEDATAEAGLGLGGWSSSAAFADADGDGDLDLYVTRYVDYDPGHGLACGDPASGRREYCDPSLFLGSGDRFYRNLGPGPGGRPRFADTTAEAGLAGADGRGLGVVFSDLDGDHHPDLYVANDLTLNLLFRNRGDGTFEDLSLVSGAAVDREGKPEAGMGIALGDVDGDLDPDLAVTNFDVETNTLYRNHGELSFEDASAASGFGPPSFNQLAFGVAFLDLDADGDLDAYVANGHIFEQPRRETVSYRQPDQVLLGDGRGGFEALACAPLEARPTVARGLAVGDYDGDGDDDLAVQENGGPPNLWRNDARPAGWLGVELRGRPPNTEAIGARVVLTTGRGRRARWLTAGDSYQSSSSRRLHFALGDGEEALELEVRWPSGEVLRLARPAADRLLRVGPPASKSAGSKSQERPTARSDE